MKTESLYLPLIEQQLNIDKFASANDLPWLEESYSSPLSFWQALKNTHNSFLPWPTKSTPFKSYDFYHDIVIRNQENSAPAFCYYNPNYGWRETSYSELGELASKKAAAWNRYGVQPGQKICIVLPLGNEYAVSLLAALKLGLVVSYLPPQGKTFLQTRLEILAPDFIASDDTYSLLLPDWQDKLLKDIGESTNLEKESSYSYSSGAIIGFLFDPASENPHVPRELTSDAAYLCPLRDGLIALGLRPGDVFSAPGFHFLETQPALLLAVLLNGATYLHLEVEDIEREPELLNAYHIKSMGISCRIRETLLQKPITIPKPWSSWFRNPLESIDFDRWEHFIQVLKIENVFAGNMLWMASFGGCSLFSIKRKGLIHFSVLPSPGIAWDLADLVSGNPESLQSYGIFSPDMIGKDGDERLPTTYILARNRNEWLFAGSSKSGRAGRSYPKTEILDVIRDNSNCKNCSIVEVPNIGINNDSLFILLVFVGTDSNISDVEVGKQIQEIIKREMGDEFLPDKIQFFPFYPRLNSDNSIDHDWCLGQYMTGALFKKAQDDIYHCLAKIRKNFPPS